MGLNFFIVYRSLWYRLKKKEKREKKKRQR